MSELSDAIDEYERAREAVRENRGSDKDLAREALDAVVAEVLIPAVASALESLPSVDVYRFAKLVCAKEIKRASDP